MFIKTEMIFGLTVISFVLHVLTLEPRGGKSWGGNRKSGADQQQNNAHYQQVLRGGPLQERLHLWGITVSAKHKKAMNCDLCNIIASSLNHIRTVW